MNTRRLIMNLSRLSLMWITLLTWPLARGQVPSNDQTALRNLSIRNQDMLLQDLSPLLKVIGGVGRLYLHSKCQGASEDVLFFPRIDVKPASTGKANLATVRDVLAANANVTVAEPRPGVTGIWIGDVSHDLLKTKIGVLTLNPRQRYNDHDAITAIIGSKEVQTKMRELQMEVYPILVHYPLVSPDPKLPHLPPSMIDMTMDEALDQVARTFGGLVIYKECRGQNVTRLFSVLMVEL